MIAVAFAGFELTGPVLALGAITGMIYGVLAVGLVLVYRSNRVINFAHGEIGAFAAAVLGVAVVRWNVPYWMAMVLALAIGGAVGGAVEVTVLRRLRAAPIIMSVIATLGVGELLVLLSSIVNAQAAQGSSYPQPAFLPDFNLGPLRVTPAYSAMLFLTPFLVVGLTFFLRRGRLGLAMRASAANPDAASMSGVLAGRMSSLSWLIAGALSAYTAILVLPTRGFTSGQLLGPSLLLRALAAAVLARMTNLPVALAAGVGLGIIERLLLANYPSGGTVEITLFAIILGTLLLQRGRSGRTDDKGSWLTVQAWDPLPESFQRVFTIRNLGRFLFFVVFLIALLLPLIASNSESLILSVIAAFTVVGMSVGIVTGLAGQLSLGQFAIAGVGAAVSVAITDAGGNFLFGFIGASLAAAAVSLVIGVPALKIRGPMLAVTTLGFALAAQYWLLGQSWMLGNGVHPKSPTVFGATVETGKTYFLFALLVLAVAFWLARNLWSGGLGRKLRAVRENEDAARAFTIQATWVKLQAFMLAGFVAGLGGALYGHALSLLSPTAFPLDASIDAAAVAVIGGIGVIAGPLLGALYILGLPQFVPLDNAGLAATSLGWLLLILQMPGGVAQAFAGVRDRIVDALARRAGLDPAAERRTVRGGGAARFDAPAALAVTMPEVTRGSLLLEARGLTKSFGGVRAVVDVHLDILAGETLGVMGPNGAGKTTLFEVLSGFVRPDSGSVVFAGTEVGGMPPEARAKLGLIRSFQDAALCPSMTVLETVMVALERAEPVRFFPSVFGFNGSERRKDVRAHNLVAMMGLHGYRNTQIRALSTGTRRITELACLLALQPTLLLLDEPSSGIAQRETEALGGLLRRMKDELGLTLVVIEHDVPLLMSISDRILAMEAGAVLVTGSPDVVRNDPRVVESYLGGSLAAIERSSAASSAGVPVGGRT